MKSGTYERGVWSHFAREWNDDDLLATMDKARMRVAPAASDHERLDRIARMIGTMRLLERDLVSITPRAHADESHQFRVGRAHALALIDLLGDIASRIA